MRNQRLGFGMSGSAFNFSQGSRLRGQSFETRSGSHQVRVRYSDVHFALDYHVSSTTPSRKTPENVSICCFMNRFSETAGGWIKEEFQG
jgi:hypothetical protein